MTPAEMLSTGNLFALFLREERGFDTVEFERVDLKPDGSIKWWFWLNDDFQNCRDYDTDHFNGTHAFTYEDINNHTHHGEPIPNREVRELTVISKHIGRTADMNGAIVSAKAKQFVEEMVEKRKQFYLLTHDNAV